MSIGLNSSLSPLSDVTEPSYPARPPRQAASSWKKIAAVFGASVALSLSACGGESPPDDTRIPGAMFPIVEEVRTPGEAPPANIPTNPNPDGKKPEDSQQQVYYPPPLPDNDQVRMLGSQAATNLHTPPEPKPPETPVRMPGRRASPRTN